MSQTTRRNGTSSTRTASNLNGSPSFAGEGPRRASSSPPSPYMLLFYPIVLAVGSLFSVLSPSASTSVHSASLAPGIASNINIPQPPQKLNYFAGKHNIINLYFVKIGWFWTTAVFILLQLTSTYPPARATATSRKSPLLQAATRYFLITLSWILTTQWFFGPALIDRSFTSTGGQCVPHSHTHSTSLNSQSSPSESELSTKLTGFSCKSAGGTWIGGHDISGHFFMLVLSSAFLFLEFWICDSLSGQQQQQSQSSPYPHISAQAAAAIANQATEEEKRAVGGWDSPPQEREGEDNNTVTGLRLWTRYFVWAVMVLDVWMLLMTAIWFHTLFEKASGLALAAGSVWLIYFLPRLVEGWREIVGGI